jgi:hypothetical protein
MDFSQPRPTEFHRDILKIDFQVSTAGSSYAFLL